LAANAVPSVARKSRRILRWLFMVIILGEMTTGSSEIHSLS
jgi:hypothetical protein